MNIKTQFDVFIKGTNIDLVVLTSEIVEQSNWYKWFNDEENTEFMQQHYFPNSRQLQLKYFSDKITEEQGITPKNFSQKAILLLQEYDWTGNIRELKNVIERLIILGGDEISENDVSLFVSK